MRSVPISEDAGKTTQRVPSSRLQPIPYPAPQRVFMRVSMPVLMHVFMRAFIRVFMRVFMRDSSHFHDRLVRKVKAMPARDELLLDLDERAVLAVLRCITRPAEHTPCAVQGRQGGRTSVLRRTGQNQLLARGDCGTYASSWDLR